MIQTAAILIASAQAQLPVLVPDRLVTVVQATV
jgi:hypothetical protein